MNTQQKCQLAKTLYRQTYDILLIQKTLRHKHLQTTFRFIERYKIPVTTFRKRK